MLHKIHIQSTSRDQMIDITHHVIAVIQQEKLRDGVVNVYCPHTTAGITINENADTDVVRDLLMRLDEVYPWKHPKYRHAEGNSAAHLKASTVGSSQTIPVVDGQLLLGTWQGIYFCEFDGPRSRTFYVKVQRG
jgi:secondary thiamine-phosphate synthase enzyme